jgi:hypothetical protein
MIVARMQHSTNSLFLFRTIILEPKIINRSENKQIKPKATIGWVMIHGYIDLCKHMYL